MVDARYKIAWIALSSQNSASKNIVANSRFDYSKSAFRSIGKVLGDIAEIYNSPEVQGVEEIRRMKQQMEELLHRGDITEESYRAIRGNKFSFLITNPGIDTVKIAIFLQKLYSRFNLLDGYSRRE